MLVGGVGDRISMLAQGATNPFDVSILVLKNVALLSNAIFALTVVEIPTARLKLIRADHQSFEQ